MGKGGVDNGTAIVSEGGIVALASNWLSPTVEDHTLLGYFLPKGSQPEPRVRLLVRSHAGSPVQSGENIPACT